MPLSGWPASCLLPAHPTGVFPIRILCSEGMCVGFAFGGTLVLQYFCPRQLLLLWACEDRGAWTIFPPSQPDTPHESLTHRHLSYAAHPPASQPPPTITTEHAWHDFSPTRHTSLPTLHVEQWRRQQVQCSAT